MVPGSELLMMTLALAVPIAIEDAKRMPLADVQQAAREASVTIGAKGDVLQFGGGKKGEAAAAFAALARGLAALSFQPGGVKFNGTEWIAVHPDSEEA